MSSDEILETLLALVSDSYDKSEGSFFYDLLSPVAIVLASICDVDILNDSFLATATSDNLDLRASEFDIERKSSEFASGLVLISGTAGTVIPAGSLVASELATFSVDEEFTIDNETEVSVTCTVAGTVGNVSAGNIKYFPVTIIGATAVINNDNFINGYDTETDDDLRERCFDKIASTGTSGNVSDYQNWALEVVGVSNVRVLPLENGAGTVEIVICDEENGIASAELIEETYNHIEENRPIGADVTVVSVTELNISISADIILDGSSTIDDVITTFSVSLSEYLDENRLAISYLSYARVSNILFSTSGVSDFENLLINEDTANVDIGDTEIFAISEVDFESV